MKPEVLDMFCGAGGSSAGARSAGARVRAGIDGWDLAELHLFELSNVEEKLRGETENTFLGIVIGPPLDNMQGVLTGVPTFLPEGPLFDNAAKANVAAS